MDSMSFILDLKEFFPETSWSQTIPALRQDALVWGALRDEEFRKRAMSEMGSTPQDWTPANLALLSLGYKLRAADLSNVPNSLPAKLVAKAQEALENLTDDSEPDLNQAGLLALALRDKPEQWQILPDTALVDTALTCLYELIPNQADLLDSLPFERVLHILLSNPLTFESQTEILERFLSAAPAEHRFSILNSLGTQRPQIAQELTGRLSGSVQTDIPKKPVNNEKAVTSRLSTPINDLQAHLQQADLKNLSANPEDARQALASAQEAVEQIQTTLVLQAALAAAEAEDAEAALSIWNENDTGQPVEGSIALAMALSEHGFINEAKSIANTLDDQSSISAAALLLKAKLAAKEGDVSSARELAIEALEGSKIEELHSLDEGELAAQLLELNLTAEAISLASQILAAKPNDLNAANVMAQALKRSGASEQALRWFHLSVTLDPQNLELRRSLADTLENLGEWDQALKDRQSIIQQGDEFRTNDHLSLANCALHASHPRLAVEICEQVLEHDPENGLAFTILGKAHTALGKVDEGLKQFEKAIQLSPELPDPWLALAQGQRARGEQRKAHQTLLTASHAAQASPQIQFALGNNFRAYDSTTKALKAYQRAAQLVSADDANLSIEITTALGETLTELGHFDEANRVLGNAHRSWPSHPGLAHVYGKNLLNLDQPEEALSPLFMALRNDPENAGIQFDYAQAQVAARMQLDQAESSLIVLLEQDPGHSIAKGLLAETLEINGKTQAAVETYHQALGSELIQDPTWMKRLSMGFSRVALKLDQAETALAALENAWEKYPEDTEIAQMLAEIYRANNLSNKALQVGKSVMQANLSNLDLVTWFAELAIKIDEPQEASEAIDKGLTLDPQQPQLHLKKGQIQLQLEDLAGACASFDQILTLEYATPADLATAAEGLIIIGDIPRAASSLERAVALYKANRESASEDIDFLTNLLKHLAHAHEVNHDIQAALEVIEEALQINKEDASLEISKAGLLIKLGEVDSATAWIEACLEKTPQNPLLSLQAARLHRAKGNLNKAVYRAQKALEGPDSQHKLSAMLLNAELALGLMQPGLAHQALHEQSAGIDTASTDQIGFYCLKGEMALTNDAEIAAADALTAALKIGTQHPRTLALRTRLYLRQGNADEAKKTLENALISLSNFSEGLSNSPETSLAIAEAAIECQAWDSAIYLLKEAAKIVPHEPRSFAELARTLVLRAEHQHLCRFLNIQNNGLGEAASAEHAFEQFEAAILSATNSLDAIRDTLLVTDYYQDFLATWLARGQAIFQPSLEHAQGLTDLKSTPDNKAAFLAALRTSGNTELAAKTARKIYETEEGQSDSPEIWGHVALSLADVDPILASHAAQTALDAAIRSAHPNYPIFYAIRANIAQHIGDIDMQQQSVKGLLSVWDNEPYWHTLAADLLTGEQGEHNDVAIQSAIAHLEKAAQLEPLQMAHHQKLGAAHLIAQDTDAAIKALQSATNLAPENPQPWLSLAEIFLSQGESRQAEKCAEQALQLDSQSSDPHLILAKIELKRGRPQGTQQHVKKALEIKPGDPQALLLQADSLIAMDDQAQALKALESASARILPTTELLLKTVELRRYVHGEKAALDSLNNMAAGHPEDPQILVAHAQALADAGESQRAIQAAQRALQSSGVDLSLEEKAHLLNTLGKLLRRKGQLDQAVKHLSQAIDHFPDWGEPYIELGRTYHERRQYDLALQTFQQAIAIAPGDPHPYYQAGMTLKETKDYPNAERMLRKAAHLTPEDVSIQRQLAAIIALNLVHNPKNVLASVRTGS